MIEIPGYRVEEKLFEDSISQYFRAIPAQRVAGSGAVIIRALRSEVPEARDRARLQNDYTVSKQLSHDGVLKPLELLTLDSGLFLVFEYFNAAPLASFIQAGSMEVSRILETSIRIADILGGVHGERVLHRNITPKNIIVDSTDWQIRLTGFDNASQFSGESTPQGTGSMEGTPAYMAPEQTGRMHRGVDYRSDLYALGAVLYELLTLEPPFRETDTLALVSALMARNPVPPHEINRKTPEVLSAIVMKLLSKSPEDRFQSSYGLGLDLRRCLSELQASGRIGSFEPGEYDPSPLFTVSRGLYGRKEELSTLNNVLETALKRGGMLVLIGGRSGVGKTSLVHAFQQRVAERGATFVSGTFDQLQQEIPYSGFIQAFGALVDQVLLADREEVLFWKEHIARAVGPNGQIIVDVIPQVELILGQQNPPLPNSLHLRH